MKTLIAIMLIVGLELSWWWLLAVAAILLGRWFGNLAKEQRAANEPSLVETNDDRTASGG